MSVEWSKLSHKIPEGWDKYVVMLAEACSAKNELVLIGRFQKVLRLIYDDHKPTHTAEDVSDTERRDEG